MPPVSRVTLTGKPLPGVTGKDVIIALCGLFNKDEVTCFFACVLLTPLRNKYNKTPQVICYSQKILSAEALVILLLFRFEFNSGNVQVLNDVVARMHAHTP